VKPKIALSEFADADQDIRRALSAAIRNCPKSREVIAEELSVAIGNPLKTRSLDNYTAESRTDYRFPAAWVAPFCEIVNDNSILWMVLGPRLTRILRLGEQQIEAHKTTTDLLAELTPEGSRMRR
jgi:hypothetical protein